MHYDIINDKSYIKDKYQTKCALILDAFKTIQKKIKVFSPDHIISLCWDILIFIIIIILVVFIPINICFQQDLIHSPIFNLACIFIFILEIIVSFNVGYYEQGHIVSNRKKISLNYLSWKFWIDFFTTACLLYVYSHSQVDSETQIYPKEALFFFLLRLP